MTQLQKTLKLFCFSSLPPIICHRSSGAWSVLQTLVMGLIPSANGWSKEKEWFPLESGVKRCRDESRCCFLVRYGWGSKRKKPGAAICVFLKICMSNAQSRADILRFAARFLRNGGFRIGKWKYTPETDLRSYSEERLGHHWRHCRDGFRTIKIMKSFEFCFGVLDFEGNTESRPRCCLHSKRRTKFFFSEWGFFIPWICSF